MSTQSNRRKLSALHEEKGKQFHECFPTDLDGLLEIYRLLQIDISACNICCSKHVDLLKNDRMLKCRDCGECRWITKDTFFERMHQPKLWLMPIWFDNEGVALNSTQLSILSDAVYSSAHNVMTKFCFAKAETLREYDGEHVSTVECLLVMKKRSTETPARMGPKAEEWEIQEAQTGSADEDSSDTDSQAILDAVEKLSDDEREIHSFLSDVPISYDNICGLSAKPVGIVSSSLTILEIAGLAERCEGQRYKASIPRAQPSMSALTSDVSVDTRTSIELFIEYIIEKFDGISRKYLELYIANHWFHNNWCEQLKQNFVKSLGARRPIRRKEILAFVTPRLVKFCKPLDQQAA